MSQRAFEAFVERFGRLDPDFAAYQTTTIARFKWTW